MTIPHSFSIKWTKTGKDWYWRTNFSVFPWKHHQIRPWWVHPKNCLPITIQILMDAATKSEACMAKKSPKDHNSTFSGYHGNILQIFWILVNHHPKGYLSWKFQLSSPDGHAASPWVTDFVTDRQAIYKLIYISVTLLKAEKRPQL